MRKVWNQTRKLRLLGERGRSSMLPMFPSSPYFTLNKQGRIRMRTIEEIQSKISLLCKHRGDKSPEIQRNYDSSLSILRWVLGEDGSIQSLGWRERVEKIQRILEDWPRDKHSAFNILHKIRDVAVPSSRLSLLKTQEGA